MGFFVRASLIFHCDVIGGFFSSILKANHMVEESTQLSQFTRDLHGESGLQLQSLIIGESCSLSLTVEQIGFDWASALW